MFADVLQELEHKLDIPYPQRLWVLQEIESDLLTHYEALREEGLSGDEARRATLCELALDADALASLEAVHHPLIRRILLRLPEPARSPAEWLCAAIPIIAVLYIFLKEVPMLDFLREGGFAMWIILLMSSAALLMQFRRAFSWFIARDHSPRSLSGNTPTPLYLAAATFVLAIGATANNVYAVLHRATHGHIPMDMIPRGIMESVTTTVMGGFLVTLILLIHTATQAGMRGLQVKNPA